MGDIVIRHNPRELSRSEQTVAQAELIERNRVLLALNELAAGLLRLDTPAAVYDLALDGILRVMGATRGAVMVVDEARGCFHLLRNRGYGDIVGEPAECLSFAGSPEHDKARLSGEIRIVHPETAGPIGQHVLATQHATTGVLLPLRVGHRVVAILSYIHDEYRDCPPGDRTLLETAATYTSAALERAILHEKMQADQTARLALDQQKDVFIALASHELKTPVTTIKGFAQNSLRALGADGDPSLRRRLTIINEQADLLTRLINDLLDTAQTQGEGLPLRPERFDLGELVRVVAENLQLTAPHYTIQVTLAATPAWVRADRQRVEQVITNLVQNAIKYGGTVRRVEITVAAQGAEATVAVRDYGVGIPADQQAHIFERFFRASNVRDHQRGLGLGLYLAHTLITRHGGRMWLTSTPGQGSTFYFSLPLGES